VATRESHGVEMARQKDVCILSTVHNPAIKCVMTKAEQEVQNPLALTDYNNTMGDVDKADQEITFYPVVRKQQKRYYKKIFYHLAEQCLWNAYVLHKAYAEKAETHADFMW